ncbi:MAG: hypothetical protein IH914_02835 [candidate division Zixibacteria bacterium]|nr:hypothetical protein [candidate division Zixibacteria bacterium]
MRKDIGRRNLFQLAFIHKPRYVALVIAAGSPFLFGGSCGEEITTEPTVVVTWQRTFGGGLEDRGEAVARVNGGYAAAGWSISFGPGAADFYLVKVNDSGRALWQEQYGGAADDLSRALVVADDGGLVMAGVTSSFGAGGTDMYLVKADANGQFLWDTTFGGAFDEEAFAILKTSDGGFLITGSSVTIGGGALKAGYVVKTDANGSFQWDTGGQLTIFANEIIGYDAIETPDGGYLIVGETIPQAPNWSQVYLAKLDSSGTLLWQTSHGGQVDDRGKSVVVAPDGDFVIVGSTTSFGAVGWDIYAMRVSASGDTVRWQKNYGGSMDDHGERGIATSDGGFVIIGTKDFGSGAVEPGQPEPTGRQMYLMKIDGSGAMLWDRTYGGLEFESGRQALIAADGGYVLIGVTMSAGAGRQDMFLLKTNSDGGI